DAIVFGNAVWVGSNPNRRFAEPAVIEISRDINGNGLPDDPWYLIPGSHLGSITAAPSIQTWDDDIDDPTYPPDNPTWIPPGRTGQWSTITFRLPANPFTADPFGILTNPN